MRKTLLLLLSIFFISGIYAQNTSVTIYKDFGVVKEKRKISVNKGVSSIDVTDIAAKIDPGSVILEEAPFSILEQNFNYDLISVSAMLNKFIGKEIVVHNSDGSYSGTLLSAAGREELLLKLKSGKLVSINAGEESRIEFPEMPENFKIRPTLTWLINAKRKSKSDFTFSYVTRGLSWEAKYTAVLNEDDSEMLLSSWISLNNNSGASYNKVKLKLIAGDVRRNREKNRYQEPMMLMAKDAGARGGVQEKSFFEYHLYDVPGEVTILNRQSKEIPLFPGKSIKIEKRFVADVSHNRDNIHPDVEIRFKNDKKNDLEMALPAGRVSIFKKDGESNELVGEDRINHTPRNEEINLNVGTAFDIVVNSETVKVEKLSKRSEEREYRVTVKNRKKESASIIVSHRLYGDWELRDSDIKGVRKGNGILEFVVDADPDEVVKFSYTILRRW